MLRYFDSEKFNKICHSSFASIANKVGYSCFASIANKVGYSDETGVYWSSPRSFVRV